jgi:ORF6N domain
VLCRLWFRWPLAVVAALCDQRVTLDADLATLYGVETKRFNEQVKRNAARFPVDFMFQLTAEEADSLRLQIATLKSGRGQHRKYLPYVLRNTARSWRP